jgi:predicted O-methyltransferase YrrM
MRSISFKNNPSNRYWWFHQPGNNYVPPIFSFLEDEEWNVMQEWYKETDAKNSAGESNIPAMSFLQGLIMGSNIRNVVQLGHYEGFSALLIGFMLKKMGYKNSFISIDIDEAVTAYTQKWVNQAQLQEYVKLIVSDSASPSMIGEATRHFNGAPKLLFIDSSHQYDHTLRELDLWYPNMEEYGIIALHDVSGFASRYDQQSKGGVNKALLDWSNNNGVRPFLLNGTIPANFSKPAGSITYQDVNGLGLIQKV